MTDKYRKPQVAIFDTLEAENEAEYFRRARMTPEQRLDEFARLQARVWGKKWTEDPMIKVVTWEKTKW